MIRIDQQIVEHEIVSHKTTMPPSDSDPSIEHIHEKLARPETLIGSTYKIKTPFSDHSLYVTINDVVLNAGTEHEQRRPFEIFINSKNMEHFQWMVALTRIISAVFRKGGDVIFLAEELRSVFDPKGGYFKKGGRYMPSLVAEIGDAIETHMRSIGLIEDTPMDPVKANLIKNAREQLADKPATDFPDGAQLCGECYAHAVFNKDGCMTCLNCGESKCG